MANFNTNLRYEDDGFKASLFELKDRLLDRFKKEIIRWEYIR